MLPFVRSKPPKWCFFICTTKLRLTVYVFPHNLHVMTLVSLCLSLLCAPKFPFVEKVLLHFRHYKKTKKKKDHYLFEHHNLYGIFVDYQKFCHDVVVFFRRDELKISG